MSGLAQDIRYALRQLRKSRGFTIAAVVTLALGIGANAVVFSVTNAFLFRPLKVPGEENLYAVWRANITAAESYPDYLDLRDRNRSFEDLAAYNISTAGLDTGTNPSRAWLYETSGNYFDAFGHSAVPGPCLPQLRRAWPEQRSVCCAQLCILAYAFSG
jgi:hypothetical protein